MISIKKPALDATELGFSDKLKQDLKDATEKLKNDYLANQTLYDEGKKKFEIDNNLYKGNEEREIKEKLLAIQHHKCCFCEQKLNGYDDVEHFRPKKAYKKSEDDKNNYPSYYWLAYEWDNLFMACKVCNSSYKKTLFPLLDEDTRAKNHTESIEKEKPLLIDFSRETVEKFITFKGFRVEGKNERAWEVIKFFALNENRRNEKGHFLDKLLDKREEHFKTVKCLMNVLKSDNLSEEEIDKAKNLVKEWKEKGEFAGMIRANFPNI